MSKVHLYTTCWNDTEMLPFFFRHYDAFVDKYFIFDDGSDASTVAFIEKHPKTILRTFDYSESHSFVLSQQHFANQC